MLNSSQLPVPACVSLATLRANILCAHAAKRVGRNSPVPFLKRGRFTLPIELELLKLDDNAGSTPFGSGLVRAVRKVTRPGMVSNAYLRELRSLFDLWDLDNEGPLNFRNANDLLCACEAFTKLGERTFEFYKFSDEEGKQIITACLVALVCRAEFAYLPALASATPHVWAQGDEELEVRDVLDA